MGSIISTGMYRKGASVERAVVDINELDQLVRDELDKIETANDFGVALWRHAKDESGANWNAYITRVQNSGSSKTAWWDVVPKLRAAFSLDGN
jgi:hypothetical protein